MLPLIVQGAALVAREFAPALVGAITGDKGEKIARAVVDTALEVTGTEKASDALDTLRQHPELAAQFRQRLLEHDEIMARLGNEDRADARMRDVMLRKLGGAFANLRADILAIGAFLLLWRIIEALIGGHVPAEGLARDAVMVVFGTALKIVSDVFQFEFGSSRGSKDKDRARQSGASAL